MAREPSYHEDLERYVDSDWVRRRFGRKVFRDGKWVRFTTPERQVKALNEWEQTGHRNRTRGELAPDTSESLTSPYGSQASLSHSLSAKDTA